MHEVGVVHNAIESVFVHVFVKVVEGIIAQSSMKSTNFYAPTDFTTPALHRESERQRERETEIAIESEGARDEGERSTAEIVDDSFILACRRRIIATLP